MRVTDAIPAPRMLIDGKLVDAADGATYPILNPATGEEIGQAPGRHRRRHGRRDRRRAPGVRRDRLVDQPRAPRALPAPAAPGAGRPRRRDARADHRRGRRAGVPDGRPAVRRAGRGAAVDHRPGRVATSGRPTSASPSRWASRPGARSGARRSGWSPRSRRGTSPTRSTWRRSARRSRPATPSCSSRRPTRPWVACELGRLAAEHTDLPPGVLNVVRPATTTSPIALATDPRVDLVSFTGSTATGTPDHAGRGADAEEGVPRARRQVGRDRARRRRPRRPRSARRRSRSRCTPARAARSRRGCSCRASGTTRRCRSPPTRWRMLGARRPDRPGHRLRPGDLGRQRDRVERYLAWPSRRAARSPAAAASPTGQGRRVLGRADGDRRARQPSRVAREEIFGPVLVVIPHDGDDDAVRIANDSPYGLSGSVDSGSTRAGAGGRPPDPHRHDRRQRRRLVRPRRAVRRLQAVRHRPRDGRRRLRGVPRDQADRGGIRWLRWFRDRR